MLAHDLPGALALRADTYSLTLPNGDVLDARQEMDPARFHGFTLKSALPMNSTVSPDGEGANVAFDLELVGDLHGSRFLGAFRYSVQCRRAAGRWVAERACVSELRAEIVQTPPTLLHRLRRFIGRAWSALKPARRATGFGAFAYLPCEAGKDLLIPSIAAGGSNGELPMPPPDLWTDSDYGAHGADQVASMMQAVEDSGLSFAEGDRILDLGCGSGRLTRELRPLAGLCEIWGLDISAPHIMWCRQNLSPPFHFATCTKVPHLPFADGSFRFVFCSSLFTHIDDLAEAWLLEIHRILASDGLLFATFHDEHTVALMEQGRYATSAMAQSLRASPTYATAIREGFGMFTIGRDSDSQVFHHSAWVEKMAAPAFEIVAVREQAYHYQTGYVMAPRGRARTLGTRRKANSASRG